MLGGPSAAFIAKYGPLTNQSDTTRGDLHFRQYSGVAQDFLIVELGSYLADTPADDAVYLLVSSPPGNPWTPTVAQETCGAFFPADAHKVNTVTVTTGGTVTGQDVIYQSATLARTFAASNFQDANLNPAQPGSFDVLYLYAHENDSSQIDSCTIEIGTQQTQSS